MRGVTDVTGLALDAPDARLGRWRVMRARVTARCRARSQHVVYVESRGWIGRGRIAEHDDIFVLEGLEGLDVRGAVAARAEI